jgi:hypothetical protein
VILGMGTGFMWNKITKAGSFAKSILRLQGFTAQKYFCEGSF